MIKAIITGATGMVGEGVLHESLNDPEIEQVLVIGRKSCGVVHTKLKEIIISDFFDLTSIEGQLAGYNTCFFCLGVSSVGMKEPEYFRLTYTLTLNFAKTVVRQNPPMTFCYISGAGTDETEKGSSMWARVKGKTENDLAKLPFKKVFNFRPGLMRPTEGLKNTLGIYQYFGWLYPLIKFLFPHRASTLAELAWAMIRVAKQGYTKQTIEVVDILALSKK